MQFSSSFNNIFEILKIITLTLVALVLVPVVILTSLLRRQDEDDELPASSDTARASDQCDGDELPSSASILTSGTASNKFTDLSCSELSGDILDNHSGDIFGNLSGDILGDHSTSGYQSDSEEKEEEDTNLEFLRLPRISIMIRRGLVKKNRKIFSSTSICG